MTIKYISKEQLWSDETTRYWFKVDDIEYCISDCNGIYTLLDSEGYPIDSCNDHEGLFDKLIYKLLTI